MRFLPPLKETVFQVANDEVSVQCSLLGPPKKRYYFNILVDGMPQILDVSEITGRKILDLIADPPKLPWYKRLWNWLTRKKMPEPSFRVLREDKGKYPTYEVEKV